MNHIVPNESSHAPAATPESAGRNGPPVSKKCRLPGPEDSSSPQWEQNSIQQSGRLRQQWLDLIWVILLKKLQRAISAGSGALEV